MVSVLEPLFPRPFALSIGPQRAATSWLDRYLRFRGDVCLPRAVKEIYYFNRFYHKGPDFYRRHFVFKPVHRLGMEVTAQSFDCPEAPRRVRTTFGDAVTLLCPLRNPILRAYSLYRHCLRYGIARGSLRDAVHEYPAILTSSHYADHLARWYEIYSPAAITLLYQEDLERDAAAYVRTVCAALSLPYIEPDRATLTRFNGAASCSHPMVARWVQRGGEWLRGHQLYQIVNAAKKIGLKDAVFGRETMQDAADMPPDDRAWLVDRLYPEIARFEKLTGRTQPDWHILTSHDRYRAA